MVNYEGIFFENEVIDFIHSIEKNRLPIVNDEIHCTFKYKPLEDEIFDEIVGQEIEVYLIGYGYDGENSGFQVQIPEEYQKYYINYDEENSHILKVPHITSSLAIGANAANTKKLVFEPLEKPIKVVGKFGYWIKTNEKEFISYFPFKTVNKKR